MRNLKRVLSLALACVMVIGMMVMTTGAADFDDAAEIEYTEAVEVANALGIIEGYNGIFDPDGVLYRDQGAKFIAYLLLGGDKADMLTGTGKFTDVTWAAGYVEYCYNVGICTGYTDTLFGAADPLSAWAFGKMLLVAMGNDADECGYNGANYLFEIKSDMKDAGLALPGLDLDATLTREQAAQMLLIALQSGGTTTRYYCVVNAAVANYDAKTPATTHGTFTNPTDAYVLCDVMNADTTPKPYKVVDGYETTGTMIEELYGMSFGRGYDVFGRPGNKYTKGTTSLFFVDTPVMSSTTTITPDELYNTLGYNATIALANSKWSNEDDTANAFLKNVAGTISSETTTPITVSAKTTGLGGDGIVTEIYKTAARNVYSVVQIRAKLAQVTAISETAANNTNGAHTDYTLTLVGGGTVTATDYTSVINKDADVDNFVSDVDLTEDAWVMVYGTGAGDKNYVITGTTAVTGKMSSFNAAKNEYTVNGTTYAKSADCVALTGYANGTTAIYLFDNEGYIVGTDSVDAPLPNYAVVTELALVQPSTTGAIGSTSSEYMEAELVFFDGTKKVVKVAKVFEYVDGTDDISYLAAPASPSATKVDVEPNTLETETASAKKLSTVQGLVTGMVVEYSVNDKDEYTLNKTAQTVTGTSGTLKTSAQWLFDTASTPAAQASAKIANNNTKFIIRTGNGTTVPYSYAVYTGYANLPTNTNVGSAAAKGLLAANSTDLAGYVYVTATVATGSADGRTKAFVYGAGTYNYVSSTNAYWEYPVIINGAATTLKVATGTVVTAGTQPVAGTMYTIDTLNDKGYVSGMTTDTGATIATAAKDGVIELSTGWKTYDENTVVSVIDAVAGTITSADITALDATGGIDVANVYVSYVKDAAGNLTAMIDQIIAVKA